LVSQPSWAAWVLSSRLSPGLPVNRSFEHHKPSRSNDWAFSWKARSFPELQTGRRALTLRT
jgi:hypothetical protein